MLKHYAIWDKTSPIITPVGEVLTAEQWVARYPVAALPNIVVVCSAGEINGGFFGTLGQMVTMYEAQGVDFSEASTDVEKLEIIEAFEEEQNTPSNEPTAEERIAAALEYQNLVSMPVENDEDPDEL
jgi:hypothetical protein